MQTLQASFWAETSSAFQDLFYNKSFGLRRLTIPGSQRVPPSLVSAKQNVNLEHNGDRLHSGSSRRVSTSDGDAERARLSAGLKGPPRLAAWSPAGHPAVRAAGLTRRAQALRGGFG